MKLASPATGRQHYADYVMRKIMRNRFCSLHHCRGRGWIALFFLVAHSALAVSFTATVDRSSVILGEQVVLTLKFDGGQPQEISNPALDGLRIVSSPSQSSAVEVTPTSRTVVYSYALAIAPLRAGDLVIPSITAKVNGQVLTSQPLKLKVAASDSTAPPAELGDKIAFLWVVLPKTNLFINEPTVAEIRIYLRGDVHRYGDLQLSPEGSGVTFSKLVEGQQYSRRVGNNMFTVVPFSVAITPVATGTASLGAINGSIVLNNRDPMEFGGFGTPATPQRAELTSPQMDIQVSPLPSDNVPTGFNGAVGSYTMEVAVGPTNLVAGDPITLRVQVSGHGALDVLTLPDLTDWDNFKAYPPTAKVNPSDPFGIEGSKTFEEIVTPLSSDVRSVPAFSFTFFDPDTKKYKTLTHPATPLIVRAATPGAMPAPTAAHAETSALAADVVPIRQHLGTLAHINLPLVQQPWFLALQGVPVFALLTTVVWRKRKESLANNPRLRRQRQVAQLVRDGLLQLQTLAADNNSNDFFATLFRLLQEQLGERLDLPAIAITEAVIEERLRPGGLDEATLTLLHELFQTCNLARYAPIESSQELAAIIPKLETALNQLRDWNA